MTDNQFNQLFDSVTKCVNGIQKIEGDVSEFKSDVSELKSNVSELKRDVAELKSDVSELKDGQKRIEKQIRLNNDAVNELAGEQIRMRSIVNDLEKAAA